MITSLIQFGFGVWVNLSVVSVGLAFGFSAVSIPQMKTNGSDIDVTTAETAWIASVLNLLSPIGCLLGSYLLDRFGRRFMLVFSQIPMAAGWLCIGLAQTALHVIVGRIITGFSIGMMAGVPRVYTTEISLPNMRGVLKALGNVALALGLTIQALLGAFLHWRILCYIGTDYACILFIVNFFLPESTYYAVMKKNPEMIIRDTLKKFRSKGFNIDEEMDRLMQFIKKRNNKIRKLTLLQKVRALFTKSACRPFWIIIPFMVFSQLSGVTVITFYSIQVLQKSKSSVNAHTGNVMMALTRLITGIFAAFFVYKFKRRPLILFSFFSISSVCLALGTYLMYTTEHTVFPQVCFIVYVACASVGIYSLMSLVMSELYPSQIRGLLGGISTSFLNVMIFLINAAFPYVEMEIGLPYTIMGFGVSALLGTIFLYFTLPDSKGLTPDEIEESLVIAS